MQQTTKLTDLLPCQAKPSTFKGATEHLKNEGGGPFVQYRQGGLTYRYYSKFSMEKVEKPWDRIIRWDYNTGARLCHIPLYDIVQWHRYRIHSTRLPGHPGQEKVVVRGVNRVKVCSKV